jgi:hypothetical protein
VAPTLSLSILTPPTLTKKVPVDTATSIVLARASAVDASTETSSWYVKVTYADRRRRVEASQSFVADTASPLVLVASSYSSSKESSNSSASPVESAVISVHSMLVSNSMVDVSTAPVTVGTVVGAVDGDTVGASVVGEVDGDVVGAADGEKVGLAVVGASVGGKVS